MGTAETRNQDGAQGDSRARRHRVRHGTFEGRLEGEFDCLCSKRGTNVPTIKAGCANIVIAILRQVPRYVSRSQTADGLATRCVSRFGFVHI